MHAADDTAVAILVRFSRLLASVPTPLEILPMLADAAIEHLGADAAVVVRVGEGAALTVAAARHVPESMCALGVDVEIGDLSCRLLERSRGHFVMGHTLPLVMSGDLYGALVLLYCRQLVLTGERLALAAGLVDLAAVALDRAFQYEELHRSFVELRTSREVLARSEKLRALGQSAAGIAHDLKNILNPLNLQLALLKRRCAGEPGIVSVVEAMERVLHRGVETIERLREFSRQEPDLRRRYVPSDLNKLVREATELAAPRLRTQAGQVRIVHRLGTPLEVTLEPSELVAALLNLIVNAIEAMGGTGTITVSSGIDDSGSWVEVEDDGPGIPPEVEGRIFEPFFTTKGEQGTGLGLAMVYAFVKRNGGTITLVTTPARGATFRLWFPAAREC